MEQPTIPTLTDTNRKGGKAKDLKLLGIFPCLVWKGVSYFHFEGQTKFFVGVILGFLRKLLMILIS